MYIYLYYIYINIHIYVYIKSHVCFKFVVKNLYYNDINTFFSNDEMQRQSAPLLFSFS